MKNLSILPTGIQTALESWKQDLEATLGDRLISAIIYDGVVKNDDAKDTDGIRVMLVMSEMSVEILDVLREVCRRFKLARQLQPFILTQQDLMTSTDVFPIRFLDMQQDYILLCGQDVMKDLTIKRDHLRLRCEQEIKNLMLRLRSSYLMNLDLKGDYPSHVALLLHVIKIPGCSCRTQDGKDPQKSQRNPFCCDRNGARHYLLEKDCQAS